MGEGLWDGGGVAGSWEAGVALKPAVDMVQTSFRTFLPNLVGTPSAAIRVVGAAPYAQRVVFKHESAALAFIGDATNELEIAGLIAPRYAFTAGAFEIHVVVVAPGQALFAACFSPPVRLAVSVSQVVPIPKDRCNPLYQRTRPATFQTRRLNLNGTPNSAIPITTRSMKPQRVIVRHSDPGALVFISSSVSALEQGAAGGPVSSAYELGPALPHIFVAAPGQLIVATSSIDGVNLSVSVSEVSLSQREGATGIPGPDGEE